MSRVLIFFICSCFYLFSQAQISENEGELDQLLPRDSISFDSHESSNSLQSNSLKKSPQGNAINIDICAYREEEQTTQIDPTLQIKGPGQAVWQEGKSVIQGARFTKELSPVEVKIELPTVILEGLETQITLNLGNENPEAYTNDQELLSICLNGTEKQVPVSNGQAEITHIFEDNGQINLKVGSWEFDSNIQTLSPWWSILPPLLAIIFALLFREVIFSLFLGIFLGSSIIGVYHSGISGVIGGFFAVIDTYILNAVADSDHVSVIVFSMLIGGMVAVISRNGGMLGVVNGISKYAKDAKSGQFATWLLGIAIFFDDYANTLVVGNTMRPVTDKLRISREKLSYLVDSTAAPISAIAFVTTWIGAELGYIKDGIANLGLMESESPYSIFLNSLSYSFYPILTLLFMLMLIFRNRDFGPMLKAENRARTTGQVYSSKQEKEANREKLQELDDLEPVKDVIPFWGNAVFPVLAVIIGTITGLLYTGWDAETWANTDLGFFKKLSLTIGDANSYQALLWASLGGIGVAVLLTIGQRIMTLEETVESAISGFKTMLAAMLILILAWSLAAVTDDLNTAGFLTSGLESWGVQPWLLPSITFLFAAIVAFSTGSSWGTMAILYPLIIPAAWVVSTKAGYSYDESLSILYNLVSCVLAGSVLGDHCSPISDTTILSSLASNCNHIDHVRTQLPYALTVGVVSVFCGTLPSALGVPSILCFLVGLGVLYLVVHFFGKEVEKEPSAE